MTMMSCSNKMQSQSNKTSSFNVEKMKPIIKKLSLNWAKGLKEKDINIFLNQYDKEAHYLPDDANALHGNKAIAENWKSAFGFLTDLHLDMETLEGTKELLYETGHGYVMLLNQSGGTDKMLFKYVNVWKRQKDGTYKVVIDMFNNFAK